MICSRRGKPRVPVMRPNCDEPKVLFGPLNWTLLKMLIISNRTIRSPPPMVSTFWNATSVWALKGVRRPVSVRGALPKV